MAGSGVNIANKSAFDNEKLAEEIHKPIIRKFEKRAVYSRFRDNIWGVDLADMELINKFSKRFRFFLCVIDIFSKYAWVLPLKGKKGITITNAFQKILDGSSRRQSRSKGHKLKKIWVDKVSEFYNTSFKKWLKGNDIEMYLIHEGRSVVAGRFIRTLKTKIYIHAISVAKNVYIDKLDDIVSEYNNTYHTTIKMKSVDVKDNTYIDFSKK